MGGFGSAQGMITSLKNNNRRTQRKAYDGWTSTDKLSKGITITPVKEETLINIRLKLKRQKRKEKYLTLLVFGISFLVLFLFFKIVVM